MNNVYRSLFFCFIILGVVWALSSKGIFVEGFSEEQVKVKEEPVAKPEEKPHKDFNNVHLTLESLEVSKDSVVVTLSFFNKTKESLLAVVEADPNQKEKVFVVDDLGNRTFIRSISGIGFIPGGSFNMFNYDNTLTCPSSVKSMASFTFSLPGDDNKVGTKYSITIPIAFGKEYGTSRKIFSSVVFFENVLPSKVTMK